MSEFKADFLLWISSIVDHWGSIGTGGILVLLIQVLKEKWPSIFNWQFSRIVLLTFLSFAMFQSWQSEYKSKVGRERDLMKANNNIDRLNRELPLQAQRMTLERDSAVNAARVECAFKNGANETLQKQNRDQQTLIAACQNQAIGLLKPEPFKETILYLDDFHAGKPNPAMKSARFLILTNKTITPVRMAIGCNSSISELSVGF